MKGFLSSFIAIAFELIIDILMREVFHIFNLIKVNEFVKGVLKMCH